MFAIIGIVLLNIGNLSLMAENYFERIAKLETYKGLDKH